MRPRVCASRAHPGHQGSRPDRRPAGATGGSTRSDRDGHPSPVRSGGPQPCADTLLPGDTTQGRKAGQPHDSRLLVCHAGVGAHHSVINPSQTIRLALPSHAVGRIYESKRSRSVLPSEPNRRPCSRSGDKTVQALFLHPRKGGRFRTSGYTRKQALTDPPVRPGKHFGGMQKKKQKDDKRKQSKKPGHLFVLTLLRHAYLATGGCGVRRNRRNGARFGEPDLRVRVAWCLTSPHDA